MEGMQRQGGGLKSKSQRAIASRKPRSGLNEVGGGVVALMPSPTSDSVALFVFSQVLVALLEDKALSDIIVDVGMYAWERVFANERLMRLPPFSFPLPVWALLAPTLLERNAVRTPKDKGKQKGERDAGRVSVV